MGTVTGLTAARMQAIIDKTIVDANVVGNNLILTLDDGSTIDAGDVRGPAGPEGPEGPEGPAGSGIADPNEDELYALAVTLMRPSKYKLKFGNFGLFTPAERIYGKSINLCRLGADSNNYASVYNRGVDSLLMGGTPFDSGSNIYALDASAFLSYVRETDVAAVVNAKKTYMRMMSDIIRSLTHTHYQAIQPGSGAGGSEKTGPGFSPNINCGTYGALVLHAESQGYQGGLAGNIGGTYYSAWGPPATAMTDTLANNNWAHNWNGWSQLFLPIHSTMDGNAMTWRIQMFTAHATYSGLMNARVVTLPANWDTDEP